MLISEALFIVCANCGEWAWNGTYLYNGLFVLDSMFDRLKTICYCSIREQMTRGNHWFNNYQFSEFTINKNLFCMN